MGPSLDSSAPRQCKLAEIVGRSSHSCRRSFRSFFRRPRTTLYIYIHTHAHSVLRPRSFTRPRSLLYYYIILYICVCERVRERGKRSRGRSDRWRTLYDALRTARGDDATPLRPPRIPPECIAVTLLLRDHIGRSDALGGDRTKITVLAMYRGRTTVPLYIGRTCCRAAVTCTIYVLR